MRFIYFNYDYSVQKQIINDLLELFLDGQISIIKPMTINNELPSKQFCPLSITSPKRQLQLIEILCKILGAVKCEVRLC